MDESAAPTAEDLDLITTQWSILRDNNRFLDRYARAIRNYLTALLGNAEDAGDVAQDFFIRVVERGFAHADSERGRFRDYLKIAVRNAAVSYRRRKQRLARNVEAQFSDVPDVAADRVWLREWQACILERAWDALARHQRRVPHNLFHTVLRVHVEHPDDDSHALAERVVAVCGQPFSADAYRKCLSRARRVFAQLIVNEVARTLQRPTSEAIFEELVVLGLRDYLTPYLG